MDLEEQYGRIYQYCYYKVHHVQAAEDITQEAFLRYFEHMGEEAVRPLAYLYTVARNLCIDEYRKKKAVGLPVNLQSEEVEGHLLDSMDLKQAMESLTEEERELIVLRFVNEVPAADLAEIYCISRFAVYRRINKTLKKLERRMSDE